MRTDADIAFSMCTVGAAGRIHDRAVLDALDWTTGTCLGLRCGFDGILLAQPAEHGSAHVAGGYFRIPFRLRRLADLEIGDRVLLVAHPQHRQLAIYPPPILHMYFGSRRQSLESQR
ncbi:hypothetical protein [Nocardia cyriacigeorgica]|uniref:hypothetical protein n=1 Tax=Nocardia cyriacigeorgica TaxID=135487 RepID=UPI00245667B7|nr:hypothetical protein [Nocardia cyriacigeorgica]